MANLDELSKRQKHEREVNVPRLCMSSSYGMNVCLMMISF